VEYTYDTFGRVIIAHQGSNFGDCCETRTEYDAAGNVTKTIQVRDTTLPNDPVASPVTTYVYDTLGRRVKTVENPDPAVTSLKKTHLTFYDALSRVTRTITNYAPQGSSAPGKWVWRQVGGIWGWYQGSNNTTADNTLIDFGTQKDQNMIQDVAYNARGQVRLRRDVAGTGALYGYDDADRLVKVIQSAKTATYNNDYIGTTPDPDLSDYSVDTALSDQDIVTQQMYDPAGNLVKQIDARGTVSFIAYDALNRPVKVIAAASQPSYNILADLDLSAYILSTTSDQDLVTEMTYDTAGRLFSTRTLIENRGTTPVWDETRYTYDSLGRQRLVIQHYQAQGSSDPKNWAWDTTDLRWEDGAGNAISFLLTGAGRADNVEVNVITEHLYDSLSREYMTRDALGHLTYQVYDALNRVVMQISNYVDQGGSDPVSWIWDATDKRWERPGNIAIEHRSRPTDFPDLYDQNIITATDYDGNSRVDSNRAPDGTLSQTGYDNLKRRKISIANYVQQGNGLTTNAPIAWVWDDVNDVWETGTGTAITRTSTYDTSYTTTDVNSVSQPEYTDESRIKQVRDTHGVVTYYVYDRLGRQTRAISSYVEQGTPVVDPSLWVWDDGTDKRWELPNGTAVASGQRKDLNRILETTYDVQGRVVSTRDTRGQVTCYAYDRLGRRTHQVVNYKLTSDPALWVWDDGTDQRWEDGSGTTISFGTKFDQNLIGWSKYDKSGLLIQTRDVRGTLTDLTYDGANRRLTSTMASGTAIATIYRTCYNKAGHVLRTIQNWKDSGTSPDLWTSGVWAFDPTTHGTQNDENLITTNLYDAANRVIETLDPLKRSQKTDYDVDGAVRTSTDPLNVKTRFEYDGLRRRVLVVQSYTPQGSSKPGDWVWRTVSSVSAWRYSTSDNTVITHGSSDENIIVRLTYDVMGQLTQLQDPRGNITKYTYDKLGRRFARENASAQKWRTLYADQQGSITRVTSVAPNGDTLLTDLDRLGRLTKRDYNSASTTPIVSYEYDNAGNRSKMIENNGTSNIRQTSYTYDGVNRTTAVNYDNDGNGTTDETVSYAYDAAGQQTQLTIPGSKTVSYSYDAKGRLIGLTDWDSQAHTFSYDGANRLRTATRPSSLVSGYAYDAASGLTQVQHKSGANVVSQYDYMLNARGHRTRAQEVVKHTGTTTSSKTYAYNNTAVTYQGTWTDAAPFKSTTVTSAIASLRSFGYEVVLTYGKGSDHSKFDVYIDGVFSQTLDGYAASATQATVTLTMTDEAYHTIEVRNRTDKNALSSGSKLRFKQMDVTAHVHALQDISYTYDKIARVTAAAYADASRSYAYQYDRAGNRTQEQVTIGATTTTTGWVYNAINQIQTQQIGANPVTNFTYDTNGRLTYDGVLTYTWNRADRLTTVNNGSYNTNYTYDGDNNRRSQTVGGVATTYLLDPEAGLANVLAQTTSGTTTYAIHGPMGVFALKEGTAWRYELEDGLGSVRSQIDTAGAIQAAQQYAPYGQPYGAVGTWVGTFGYAGEQIDGTGLSYNRARYYNPALGAFASLDPFEGVEDEPMSMNGYSYVHGNPVNLTDPSGEFVELIVGAIGVIAVTAIAGAVVGAAVTAILYAVAVSGVCGCQMKEEVQKRNFIDEVLKGAGAGAIGALVGLGITAFAVVGGAPVAAAAGVTAAVGGGIGLGFAIYDMLRNGVNPCNILQALFSIAGGLSGGLGAKTPELNINIPNPFGGGILQPAGGPSFGGATTGGISITIPSVNTAAGIGAVVAAAAGTGSQTWGDCDEKEYIPLREIKDKACNGVNACKDFNSAASCQEIEANIQQAMKCVRARLDIRNACYKGKDDSRHSNELNTLFDNMGRCVSKAKYWCPNMKIPEKEIEALKNEHKN